MKRRNLISSAIVIGTLVSALLVHWCVLTSFEANNVSFTSENPQFITLGRLERVDSLHGDVVIVGSSVTERMRSSEHISVIGVPGCQFTTGLSLIKEGQFPEGTCFAIEGYNILSEDGGEIKTILDGWRFHAAKECRFFSHVAKPSALLLTSIYHVSSDHSFHKDEESTPDLPNLEPSDVSGEYSYAPKRQAEFEQAVAGIRELRAKGYRVCIVYYPEHSGNYDERIEGAKAVAKACDVPLLDYHRDDYDKACVFTDKVHFRTHSPATMRFRNAVARDVKKWAK